MEKEDLKKDAKNGWRNLKMRKINMKKTLIIAFMVAAISMPLLSDPLVVYFSRSGNTESVAERIAERVDADVFEIETVQEYPENYDELLDYARNEQRSDARPELSAHIDDIERYDVIFLGYPNWWGDMPMPLYSFLDEYDLSDKTIMPFVTSGGSGFSRTIRSIESEEPEATVLEGLSIRDRRVHDSSTDRAIEEWIEDSGLF